MKSSLKNPVLGIFMLDEYVDHLEPLLTDGLSCSRATKRQQCHEQSGKLGVRHLSSSLPPVMLSLLASKNSHFI